MTRNHIPTASYASFDNLSKSLEYARAHFPMMIKVSGVTHGKGVFCPDNIEEAEHMLRQIFEEKVFEEEKVLIKKVLGISLCYYSAYFWKNV